MSTQIFVITLFIKPCAGSNSQVLQGNKNYWVFICRMEYYSAIKKNLLINAKGSMNLKELKEVRHKRVYIA